MSERWKLALLVGVFALAFFLPIESPRMQGALLEGFWLLKDYARKHVLLCLVPPCPLPFRSRSHGRARGYAVLVPKSHGRERGRVVRVRTEPGFHPRLEVPHGGTR